MNFPAPFQNLGLEPGPVILKSALSDFALHEIAGPKNHEEIMAWAMEAKAYFGPGDKRNYYSNDETPWCALAMHHWALSANFTPPRNPLAALSWAEFGNPVPKGGAMLGDVLVKSRVGGGHVGLYVGETDTHYAVLGGNQNNQVCIAWFSKEVFSHIRRCPWRYAQPENVRKIKYKGFAGPVVSEA